MREKKQTQETTITHTQATSFSSLQEAEEKTGRQDKTNKQASTLTHNNTDGRW